MGLLSFLSSRKPSDRPPLSPTLVKSQAYEATTPSLPPVRGTYPVAGNGPVGTFETAQRSLHLRNEDQLINDGASDNSAPAPIVPRFRELTASIDRPKTAPNGAGGPRRLRRESFKRPPIAFRKPKSDSISSIARSTPEPPLPQSYSAPLTPLQPPGTPFRYQRSDSIHSVGSGRGFVDLLDAQSELRPQGFQTRVKAAGAKDFGEDVADRNIGANGPDSTPRQSQAFYPEAGKATYDRPDSAPAPDVKRSRLGHSTRVVGAHEGDNSDPIRRKPRPPFINGLAQNPSFPIVPSGPQDERQAHLHRHLSQTGRSGRRQSLSSYIPTAPTTYISPSPRPQSMHRPTNSSHFATAEHRSVPAPLPDLPVGIRGWGKYSHLLPKSEPEPPPSPSFARDSVLLARSNYSLPTHSRTPDRPYREKASMGMQGSDYEDLPEDDGFLTTPETSPRHDVNPGASSQGQTRRRQKTAGAAPRIDTVADIRRPGTAGSSSASHSRAHNSAHHYTDGWEAAYPRTKSMTSTQGRLRLDEIYEHIPMRTSSLIPTSVASTTPTVSSTTSSQYPRPHSRHTPNTSIDLATISSQVSKSPASAAGDDASSYWTAMEDRSPSTRRATVSPTYEVATASFQSTFNIDDYLSSEDEHAEDGQNDPRRVRGETEGDLLFQDSGYGGLQLPGLYDSLPGTDRKLETRSDVTLKQTSAGVLVAMHDDDARASKESYALGCSPDFHDYYGGPEQQVPEQDIQPQETSNAPDEEPSAVQREDLATGRKGMTRISALGTGPQGLPTPIIEEKEDKVDIRTAIRLRKEAKARKRAEGEGIAREKLAEKRKHIIPETEKTQVDRTSISQAG